MGLFRRGRDSPAWPKAHGVNICPGIGCIWRSPYRGWRISLAAPDACGRCGPGSASSWRTRRCAVSVGRRDPHRSAARWGGVTVQERTRSSRSPPVRQACPIEFMAAGCPEASPSCKPFFAVSSGQAFGIPPLTSHTPPVTSHISHLAPLTQNPAPGTTTPGAPHAPHLLPDRAPRHGRGPRPRHRRRAGRHRVGPGRAARARSCSWACFLSCHAPGRPTTPLLCIFRAS